jgi:hypothetical protein
VHAEVLRIGFSGVFMLFRFGVVIVVIAFLD